MHTALFLSSLYVHSSDQERSHVIVPQTWQPKIDESLTWHTELWKYAVEEGRHANQEPDTQPLLYTTKEKASL